MEAESQDLSSSIPSLFDPEHPIPGKLRIISFLTHAEISNQRPVPFLKQVWPNAFETADSPIKTLLSQHDQNIRLAVINLLNTICYKYHVDLVTEVYQLHFEASIYLSFRSRNPSLRIASQRLFCTIFSKVDPMVIKTNFLDKFLDAFVTNMLSSSHLLVTFSVLSLSVLARTDKGADLIMDRFVQIPLQPDLPTPTSTVSSDVDKTVKALAAAKNILSVPAEQPASRSRLRPTAGRSAGKSHKQPVDEDSTKRRITVQQHLQEYSSLYQFTLSVSTELLHEPLLYQLARLLNSANSPYLVHAVLTFFENFFKNTVVMEAFRVVSDDQPPLPTTPVPLHDPSLQYYRFRMVLRLVLSPSSISPQYILNDMLAAQPSIADIPITPGQDAGPAAFLPLQLPPEELKKQIHDLSISTGLLSCILSDAADNTIKAANIFFDLLGKLNGSFHLFTLESYLDLILSRLVLLVQNAYLRPAHLQRLTAQHEIAITSIWLTIIGLLRHESVHTYLRTPQQLERFCLIVRLSTTPFVDLVKESMMSGVTSVPNTVNISGNIADIDSSMATNLDTLNDRSGGGALFSPQHQQIQQQQFNPTSVTVLVDGKPVNATHPNPVAAPLAPASTSGVSLRPNAHHQLQQQQQQQLQLQQQQQQLLLQQQQHSSSSLYILKLLESTCPFPVTLTTRPHCALYASIAFATLFHYYPRMTSPPPQLILSTRLHVIRCIVSVLSNGKGEPLHITKPPTQVYSLLDPNSIMGGPGAGHNQRRDSATAQNQQHPNAQNPYAYIDKGTVVRHPNYQFRPCCFLLESYLGYSALSNLVVQPSDYTSVFGEAFHLLLPRLQLLAGPIYPEVPGEPRSGFRAHNAKYDPLSDAFYSSLSSCPSCRDSLRYLSPLSTLNFFEHCPRHLAQHVVPDEQGFMDFYSSYLNDNDGIVPLSRVQYYPLLISVAFYFLDALTTAYRQQCLPLLSDHYTLIRQSYMQLTHVLSFLSQQHQKVKERKDIRQTYLSSHLKTVQSCEEEIAAIEGRMRAGGLEHAAMRTLEQELAAKWELFAAATSRVDRYTKVFQYLSTYERVSLFAQESLEAVRKTCVRLFAAGLTEEDVRPFVEKEFHDLEFFAEFTQHFKMLHSKPGP